MPPPARARPTRASSLGGVLGACLVTLAASGCASAGAGSGPASAGGDRPAETAAEEETATAYTDADVAFMRGMIHHHAQAVVMARLAPDRAASPALRRLAARILNSQKTEIALMADWLRDRGEPVPALAAPAVDSTAGELRPRGGWDAGPRMPGVLADAQMERLAAARGEAFDRLFLTYMIEHHEGAVTMVKNLVASPNAAREESVFRLASGIRADQASEIDRMRTMLRESLFGADRPR